MIPIEIQESELIETKPLPHSLEAEGAVLGAILSHEEHFDHAAAILKPADFYRRAHGLIYEAMLDLKAHHSAIDGLTVKDHLAVAGNLDAVGGATYLFSLTDGIPRSTNVDHYARIVKEKATRRRAIAEAGRLIEHAYTSQDTATEIIGQAQQAMFSLADDHRVGLTPIADLAQASLGELEALAAHKGMLPGIPSGFPDLDALTAGFQPTDLIVIGARPSMGKTALALNIAEHVGIKGRAVAIFSLEMSKQQLFMRLLAGHARVDAQRLKTGRLYEADYSKIAHSVGVLGASNIYIDDSAAIGIVEIGARCRRMASEHGLDLVIIDYLQLMRSSGGRYENRQNEVAQMSRGLKVLAKELSVPIIVLSQLSRAPESRSEHRPMLSDLRESGTIEQDADVVIFLYRDEVYADPNGEASDTSGLAELIIAKQRNGPTDTVKVAFLKQWTRFESLGHHVADQMERAAGR